MKKMRKMIFCSLMLINLIACSSSSPRAQMYERLEKSKASPHTYGAENMMDSKEIPEREYRHWEFYYKHCALLGYKPYPTRGEYDCMAPH